MTGFKPTEIWPPPLIAVLFPVKSRIFTAHDGALIEAVVQLPLLQIWESSQVIIA